MDTYMDAQFESHTLPLHSTGYVVCLFVGHTYGVGKLAQSPSKEPTQRETWATSHPPRYAYQTGGAQYLRNYPCFLDSCGSVFSSVARPGLAWFGG